MLGVTAVKPICNSMDIRAIGRSYIVCMVVFTGHAQMTRVYSLTVYQYIEKEDYNMNHSRGFSRR